VAGHYQIRHAKIGPNGTISLRHAGKMHHLGIDRAWAGKRVLGLVVDREVRIVTQDGELLGTVQIDPEKDCQPVENL